MAKKARFLPERLEDALRGFMYRASGVAILLAAIGLIFALVFHNPYLSGFAARGNFGDQSVVGNFISFMRYGIGWIPTMFLFLCLARWGLFMAARRAATHSPEYNILRGFITVGVGCAALGAMFPHLSFGGIAGFVVASDIARFLGDLTWVAGVVMFAGFLLMAAGILNIKWNDVRTVIVGALHGVRWMLSAFHLIKPIDDDEQEEYEEEGDEEEEEEETSDKKHKTQKRKPVSRKQITGNKERSTGYDYELPNPAFMEKSSFGRNVITPELKRNASAMEAHFEEFGVYGKVMGIKPGPVVTLYEFEPDSGQRIAKIADTVKDMTRAMATENIRIAHIPRTNYIGVEMANLNRQSVRFRGLIDNPVFTESKYKIPLALGVDIGGNPMYFDLAKMPHVLVAGRTGSGKSVFVQSIILSVLYHFTPDQCKLILVDPKGVDFTLWDNIPHLVTPVLTDPAGSVNALKWSVREMEERYKKLKELGVQNIEGYNEAARALRARGEKLTRQVAVGTDPETGGLEFETQEIDLEDMPYLVIIIDEVADLMSVARKEVEACVQRLAQKARAAGIHLAMATQRPDTTVITGVIKANFPTRISFQARSNIDSMTTLGEKGAEQLSAFGDMLFSEAGRVPVRIHSAWIENKEMNRVADFLRAQGAADYIDGVTDGDDADGAGGAVIPGMPMSKDAKDGDMYEQAKQYVIRDKKPTISYIQRRLGVGYNKAAGFMERMEREGIVSAPDANNKRQIL